MLKPVTVLDMQLKKESEPDGSFLPIFEANLSTAYGSLKLEVGTIITDRNSNDGQITVIRIWNDGGMEFKVNGKYEDFLEIEIEGGYQSEVAAESGELICKIIHSLSFAQRTKLNQRNPLKLKRGQLNA